MLLLLWDDEEEFDLDVTLYELDMMNKERQGHVRRMIGEMTKKQITAVLSLECKLKWAVDEKHISESAMRDSLTNVLFSPNALYNTTSAENGLLARDGELLYKVPVSVLKSETNKLLRKAGQDDI